MDNTKIIRQTEKFVQSRLHGESSGHDWWHVYRVWKNSVKIFDFDAPKISDFRMPSISAEGKTLICL